MSAKTITLTITIDVSTGRSDMNAPLNSPGAMYWLLGEAQHLYAKHLREQDAKANERRIVVPELHIDPGSVPR